MATLILLEAQGTEDGLAVALPEPVAVIAALVLEALGSEQSAPELEMPTDPLARLELEQSQAVVDDVRSSLVADNSDVLMRALHAWAQGQTVIASREQVWQWSQAFNGAYTTLRSRALAREGFTTQVGTPAEIDLDAGLAALLGGPVSEEPAGPDVDAAGWDEITALFAALTNDCLDLAFPPQ